MSHYTPRTDKEAFREGYGGLFFVPAEFARQLERELDAALLCAGVAAKERGEWALERERLIEEAALLCDREADRQAAYANEAGTPGLRLIHDTAANTLIAVAQRIRALKGA